MPDPAPGTVTVPGGPPPANQFRTVEEARTFLGQLEARTRAAEDKLAGIDDVIVRKITDAVQRLGEDAARQVQEAKIADREHGDWRGIEECIQTAPDGQPIVRMLGDHDPLTGHYVPGLLDRSEHVHGEWHQKVRDCATDLNLLRIMLPSQGEDAASVKQRIARTRAAARMRSLLAHAPDPIRDALKANTRLFGDISTAGQELIPSNTLPRYERDAELARRVEALFPVFNVTTKTTTLPYMSQGLRPFLKGTSTTEPVPQHTTSTPTTAARTFTPVGFAVHVQLDEDLAEDSIVESEAMLRQECVRAIVDGMEDAIINGCTGTHDDTGLASWTAEGRWDTQSGGTNDHRRAFLGLRALATDKSNTTDQTAAETSAGALTAMGKLAAGYATDLCWIPSPLYYVKKMLGFTEVITIDKMGPQATLMTGQLANLFGWPVIPSQFCGNQYNASGVYDNSTKTKGGLLVFNRSRFVVAVRRQGSIEAWKDIRNGVTHLVITTRKQFKEIDGTSTKNVHWSYNLTATS